MANHHSNHSNKTQNNCAATMEAALEVIEGKWKLMILTHLSGQEIMRFSDLERAIPRVSQKMLAKQLRSLETAQLIHRTVIAEVPPRVEYRLTELGWSLEPVLIALLEWGMSFRQGRADLSRATPPV